MNDKNGEFDTIALESQQKSPQLSGDTKHSSKSENQKLMSSEIKIKIPPENLKNWMTNLPQRLCDIPIWKLVIPGSHNSGSYGLETESGIGPDRPDLKNNTFVRLCSCIALPAIYRWTKTQNLDIKNQLNAGIRYFDIRVASKTSDDNLYFVHGLYGPLIMEILQEISAFAKENPKEIIFLDFQHFYGVSDNDHKQLIAQLINIFGIRIVPYASLLMMNNITLNYLWNKGQQIFIYYRDESARSGNPNLWPTQCLPNPWANTIKTEYLINYLTTETSKRPPNSMFVSQGILTPSNNYVAFHLFSSLHDDLVIKCNRSITQWLKDQSTGPKGPNILMIDFVDWNNYTIPNAIVRLNMDYLKKQ